MMQAALAAALLLAGPAPVEMPVVTPAHLEGPHMPRLVKFADPRIQAAVNILFARREAKDRAARRDCLKQVRDNGAKDGDFQFDQTTEVSYVSAHYAGLRVRTSYYCGGAYPDGTTEGIAIDLTTAKPVDWDAVFKPGRMNAALATLYRARYANSDPQCREAVGTGLDEGFALVLDAHKGLVAEPMFPHAIQACADAIAFSARDLAPYVADKDFLADLAATVR
jgi:hypothetical protein